MKYYFTSLLILLFVSLTHSEERIPQREKPPRLAVFPLFSEKDVDYGVFMADRLVDELIRHRDLPAYQGRWFELVEPDTIHRGRMQQILEIQQTLKGDDLTLLRTAANADRALIGSVSHAGTRALHLRLVNLETGELIWTGMARDDEKWQWIYAQKKPGEIVLGNVMSQFGFKQFDRHDVVLKSEELPLRVAFASLFTSQRALVGGYERLIRENILANNLFGELETAPGVGARFGKSERETLSKNKGIDAVLCGSMMAAGKDNAINTVSVALRLVETGSGRILWAGSAHAQRVWRKDQFDDMTQLVATDLVLDLARARAGARSEWANDPEPQDGPGWVNRGMTALERGLLDQAEEAFLAAEKFADSQVRAYEGLGKVYAHRPALRRRAIDYLYKAIEADTTRADLYYDMASVYFDIGTEQCLVMAQRAIALDSTFSAPYRLVGDWYARDDWYARAEENAYAAAYYSRYLELEPDDVAVATHLGEVLLRMEDDAAIARQILPFLQAHPEAIDLLPIAAQRAQRLTQYDTSAVYWERYLERIDNQTQSLYVDPEPILSDAQRAVYRALPDAEKQGFVDRFWMQKDQDATTETNERLLEHYQRVWSARKYFAASAYPWDRRGRVYIRYGEPDYRSRSGRAPGVMSAAVQQVKDRLYAELYNQPPEGAVVGTVFPVRSSRAMMAEETFGVRMNDADTFTQGDAYLPVTSGEDHSLVPWESWVYVSIGGGMEMTFTDEMGSGHFDFAPPPLRLPPSMRSISRIQEHTPEATFDRAVAEIPEQHRPWWQTRDLSFYYDVFDARGQADQTRLDVAFALPVDETKTGRGDLTLAVALYDSITNQTWRMDHQVVRSDSLLKTGAMLTHLLTLQTPPGGYRLTVKAENSSANRISVFQQAVEVQPYTSSRLQMSDLILAAQIAEIEADGPFQRGPLRVVPLPTRSFLSGQELGLYFEVYNLIADAFGQMRYRVTIQVSTQEQTGEQRSGVSSTPSNPEVSLTFEQVDSQPSVQVYQFVNLSKARQGRNRMIVTVEDVNTNQRVTKETDFRYGQ